LEYAKKNKEDTNSSTSKGGQVQATEEEQIKREKVRTRIDMFEKQLPMRKLIINEWEQVVRGIGGRDKETVTAEALVNGLRVMKGEGFWKEGLLNKESVFVKIIEQSKILKAPESEELSKNALMIWGLLYCKGEPTIKAKYFFEVLQD
jgi:hypothetical protein